MSTTSTFQPSINRLNSLLRTELAAVDNYRLALDSVKQPLRHTLLEECLHSHERRADLLRDRIRELGGNPSSSGGPWGVLTQVIEGTAREISESAALGALEEFEYHDVGAYRRKLKKLDPDSRTFVERELLDAQDRTYQTVRSMKRAVH
jgi:bacterioferritin (cytochrome b1)